MVSVITAIAPLPESGRISAMGSASAGKPSSDVIGDTAWVRAPSAPEYRNMATPTRIATRNGMIMIAISKPSRAPAICADSRPRMAWSG